jgi:hypothetical protein
MSDKRETLFAAGRGQQTEVCHTFTTRRSYNLPRIFVANGFFIFFDFSLFHFTTFDL